MVHIYIIYIICIIYNIYRQKQIENGQVGPTKIVIDFLYNLPFKNNEKKTALTNAINGYCNYLKKSNPNLNCNGNSPPNGANTYKSIFGGIFNRNWLSK